MDTRDNLIEFLNEFFYVFDAEVSIDSFNENRVLGKAFWREEGEFQSFNWRYCNTLVPIEYLTRLIKFLSKNCYLEKDRVLLSPDHLLNILVNKGWNQKIAVKSIKSLTELSVVMIDDGEETDSFFLHF